MHVNRIHHHVNKMDNRVNKRNHLIKYQYTMMLKSQEQQIGHSSLRYSLGTPYQLTRLTYNFFGVNVSQSDLAVCLNFSMHIVKLHYNQRYSEVGRVHGHFPISPGLLFSFDF